MGLKRRLTKLEGGSGVGECSCGIFSIHVAGKFVRARRHGELISEEEYRDFKAAQSIDGTCTLCGGTSRPVITVGGPGMGRTATW